ncbi:unnamed protein product [Knipowitschia caucasica]|uniref:B30.2/SPRY domain-containing protein n=1 Tax=Knipowitschia caucasica TaxID=637954 RepID=A0AAV2IXF6_KNICA
MSDKPVPCDLMRPSDSPPVDTAIKASDQPIFSVLSSGGVKMKEARVLAGLDCTGGDGGSALTTDSESGIFSGECELCEDHEAELDWFCDTEQKLVCSHCATVGPCRAHALIPLSARVSSLRNHLVDVCEKIQLQALRVERFIQHTLTDKEQKLQAAASRAREQVLSRVSAAREALEEEEQRLLEAVQREEERVEQCLLTQQVHWKQALTSLNQTRAGLVHTLTHTPDTQLAISAQDISERVEGAEGVGEPCDTEQLEMKSSCSDSAMLTALWATAVLLGPNADRTSSFQFDARTVSPLLSLSEDLFTLTFTNRKSREPCPYDPARFDSWPNALGSRPLSSGTHRWVLDVGQSAAFKVGVCHATLERKGSGDEARLGHNLRSWVLSNYDGEYSFWHGGRKVPLHVVRRPRRVGVLLDWPTQTLLFYEPESNVVLYSLTDSFSAPLLPACAVTDRSITIVH